MVQKVEGEGFGDYFRRLRRSKGFKSQKILAEKSGVSQATISRIEDGTQKPLPETLLLLADALNSSAIELLVRSGYLSGNDADKKIQRNIYFSALQKDGVRDIKNNLTIGGKEFLIDPKNELEKLLSENKPPGVNTDNFLFESEKLINGIHSLADQEELGDYLNKNKALFDTISQLIKYAWTYNPMVGKQMSLDIYTGEIKEAPDSEMLQFDSQQVISEAVHKITEIFHQFKDNYEDDSRSNLYFEKNLENVLAGFAESVPNNEAPKEIIEILSLDGITYAGHSLEDPDRQRILDMLKLLFPDRQDNSRDV